MFRRRKRLNRRVSKKIYKKGMRTKTRNFRAIPMRGGYRI